VPQAHYKRAGQYCPNKIAAIYATSDADMPILLDLSK
jgi:hypothetical protein